MRDISYGEHVALETEFDKQCKAMGVIWTDEEIKSQALNEFVLDYMNGDDDPQVMLCECGYEMLKKC